MSSKLSYLSKYIGDGGGSNSDFVDSYNETNEHKTKSSSKKKSKRDKKKGKKASKKNKKHRSDDDLNGVLQMKDDDDDAMTMLKNAELNQDNERDDEEDGPMVVEESKSANLHPLPRRQRHDSSSEESNHSNGHQQCRRRHDSSDESIRIKDNRKRQRHDSSSSEDDDASRSSFQKTSDKNISTSRRQRHDSDSSKSSCRRSIPRRQRHDSESSSERSNDQKNGKNTERMASGHVAGLQTGRSFSKAEVKLQSQRRAEAQRTVDKYGMGETIYRDSSKNAATDKKKSNRLTKEEQIKLNKGKVQQDVEEQRQRDLAKLEQSAFARHKDDTDLEDHRKSIIYADDPMAAHHYKKQNQNQPQKSEDTNVDNRPVYKGPPPKPNRFGIRPGYRWDANDRGNGFEDKLLAKKYNAKSQQERAYRHSCADM